MDSLPCGAKLGSSSTINHQLRLNPAPSRGRAEALQRSGISDLRSLASVPEPAVGAVGGDELRVLQPFLGPESRGRIAPLQPDDHPSAGNLDRLVRVLAGAEILNVGPRRWVFQLDEGAHESLVQLRLGIIGLGL